MNISSDNISTKKDKDNDFVDPVSGINPFTPANIQISTKIAKYSFGILMLILRLPVLVVLFTLLFIYHTFFKGLMVVKEVRRFFTLFIHLFLYRLIMLTFGIFTFKSTHKFFTRDANLPKMGSGWIILCNHTSPLDLFYLSYIPTFVKIFVKVKNDGQKEILLAPLNYWSTIKFFFSRTFQLPVVANEVEMATMAPYKKLSATRIGEANFESKEGPIVVFFEGGYTNGKGVLEIDELLAADIYDYAKKYLRMPVLMSLRYDDMGGVTSRHPVLACLSILMNPLNNLDVRISSIKDFNYPKKYMSNKVHEIFENEQGLPKLSLNFESYRMFLGQTNVNSFDRNEKSKTE